ncbi:hypothetical protein AD949_08485 [Acetobacter orleanensis]|nr:hypothetical protein AD949_08485 [Acetobacter orleanensis]
MSGSGHGFVNQGGLASETHVSGGWLEVNSGGVASGGDVANGQATVHVGASAVSMTANSGGYIYDNGGVVSSITVNSKGTLGLDSGGQAYNTSVTQAGGLSADGSGTVIVNTWQSGAYTSVYGGAEASSGQVISGWMTVDSGGVASAVTAQSGGGLLIGSNGSGNMLNVTTSGYDVVSSGAITTSTTVGASGTEHVKGGVASQTVLQSGAVQYVTNSGLAVGATVENGGQQTIGSVDVNYWGSGYWGTGTSAFSGGGAVASSTIVSAGGSALVNAGGSSYETSVKAGGHLIISAGGSGTNDSADASSGIIVGSGAYETVVAPSAGGTWNGSNVTVANGGTYNVSNGGTATSATVQGGGVLNVYAGGSAVNASATTPAGGQAGTINVYSRGATTGTILTSNSTAETISNGGTATGTQVSSGAGQTIMSGGVAYNTSASDNGHIFVYGGTTTNASVAGAGSYLNVASGIASGTTVSDNGTVNASSGTTLADTTVANGGTLIASSGTILTGTTTLYSGGSATIWNDAGGTVNLQGSTNTGLTISGLENGGTATTKINVLTEIDGFNGTSAGNSDGIKLAGVTEKDITAVAYVDANNNKNGDYVTLTLQNKSTITLHIPGAEAKGYSLSKAAADGSVLFEVCFLAGSMIRTASGDVAVETLRIGDSVQTWDWKAQCAAERAVIWTGRKSMHVNTALADDEAGYPVRILKDALAVGVPSQDLLVTPEHSLFFEDKFVPVRMLVNGRSIVYDRSITSYDYFHIETEEHSVIWANDTLTESYLDTGNRGIFRQDGSVVRLTAKAPEKTWDNDGAATLTVERTIVEPLFQTLADRAVAQGLVSYNEVPEVKLDSDIHLVTGQGQSIRPVRQLHDKVVFMIPADVETVQIVTRTSRPSDTIGPFVDDRRHLGVLVGQVTLFDGKNEHAITSHLDQAELSGWNTQETVPCRWTNGNATLQLPDIRRHGLRMLTIQIIAAGPYVMTKSTQKVRGLKAAG